MGFFEKKLTHRTVLIISGSVFLFIAIVLTLFSLLLMKENTNDISYTDESCQVFESIPDISVDISDEISDVFADISVDESEESSQPLSELEHGWVINEMGYTYIYGDCGYEQFNYTAASMNRYIDSLNRLAESLPDGMQMYNIIAPISSTFASIPREIYVADNFYNKSQSAFAVTVASKTSDRIEDVSVVSTLEDMYDDGEYVFYRTDRNWTSLAAYTAYTEFCKAASIGAYPITAFDKVEICDFLGSFYRSTGCLAMQDNPDKMFCLKTVSSVNTSLTVYDGDLIYSDYTLCGNTVSLQTADNFYLGTRADRYEINTTADGGRLLIIGDSSAHPLIPLLASHYKTIDYINPTEFKLPLAEFLAEHRYDSLLTVCYSSDAVSGSYVPSFNTVIGDIQNG